MSDIKKYYREKESKYFSLIRADILSLIKGKDLSVFEIGCGSGATLIHLKQTGVAKEAVGLDIHASAIKKGRTHLDRVLVGNIETMEPNLPKNHFDAIILADVLEHMIDPDAVLLRLKKYLKTDGRIFASIPNIRVWYALFPILFKGDFGYKNAGVMDKSHIRFFCKKNIRDLFSREYTIELLIPAIKTDSSKKGLLNKLTLGFFEEFLTPQYLVVAQKKGVR
jgi:2-polyprenyl-3-methyl-5-hydroxy-6-metoxy-1,4-benzoquinol methylase